MKRYLRNLRGFSLLDKAIVAITIVALLEHLVEVSHLIGSNSIRSWFLRLGVRTPGWESDLETVLLICTLVLFLLVIPLISNRSSG